VAAHNGLISRVANDKHMKLRLLFSCLSLILIAKCHAAPPAFILNDPDLPGSSVKVSGAVASAIRDAGYAPKEVTFEDLLHQGALSADNCKLLVFPQCGALPGSLQPIVLRYLQEGGRLIALGAPAWNSLLFRDKNGKWITPSQFSEKHALQPPAKVVFPFTGNLDGWVRSTNTPASPASYTLTSVNAKGGGIGVLHAVISNLDGWDTFQSPALSVSPFSPGMTNTVFSARGGPRTIALAVEWQERDGSRWIATVPLSQKWGYYSLPPSAFKSWMNSPEKAAQGFNPADAAVCRIGLAFTHTGTIGGRQEYWISEVGVGPSDQTDNFTNIPSLTPLDTICPKYKFFPLHGEIRLSSDPGQDLVTYPLTSPLSSKGILSTSPRPSGAGFLKDRPWRWVSLIRATDARTGEWRGTPATLLLWAPGSPYAGGIWMAAAMQNPNFYLQPAFKRFLIQTAKRMRRNLFFLDAGAEYYTCLPGEAVRLGARLMNMGDEGTAAAIVRINVSLRNGETIYERSWKVRVPKGAITVCDTSWRSKKTFPSDGYVVTATLIERGEVIDRLSQSLYQYRPSAHPNYVKIRPDGHFYFNNRLWRINGVNYMPSSGIAQEDGDIFEHWMSRAAYDPVVVERDLKHIAKLGMNAVSIFIYRQNLESHNLIDILRRCRELHLHVYLSLRPGVLDYLHMETTHPLQDAIHNFVTIIKRYHLNRDDTIFNYEVAWEPNFGDQQGRELMDPAWRKWVTAKYGDVRNAEQAWGELAPLNSSGELTNPSGAQLSGTDPHAVKLVADYRHFLDQWLVDTYGAAAKAIHAIAPHQFVSFRMASAGNPEDDQRGGLPYQFEGLAHAVDFLAPECYGRVGSKEGDQGIVFEIAYARAAAPHKPVIWAETGVSAWNTATQSDDPSALEYQGFYYNTFYKLAMESGADGIFYWWYPGGFRVGENSDYGLINPDGTPRPSTEAVLHWGAKFLHAPAPRKPNKWFSFNRDDYPGGVYGVFQALRKPFFKAMQEGFRPGLRNQTPWEPQGGLRR